MKQYLKDLENESLHIIREAVAEAENPVMMYSIGKDSSVMLHLALKAFYPMKPPFPLLHVDTTWKFKEMISFRDETVKRLGMDLIVYTNQEGVKLNINPIDYDSAKYTDVMKTEALKQILSQHQFDMVFGGARRDEEKSRAKERIFSFRDKNHVWDPKNQRPEFWNLYNLKKNKGESIRVFPISNWTEMDIWNYIAEENIPVVPLYFAKERPVVRRNAQIIMVDDERFTLKQNEKIEMKKVRFRTLGCFPLTAGEESNAETISELIEEMKKCRVSERAGRLIDFDQVGSMEKKKREGYF